MAAVDGFVPSDGTLKARVRRFGINCEAGRRQLGVPAEEARSTAGLLEELAGGEYGHINADCRGLLSRGAEETIEALARQAGFEDIFAAALERGHVVPIMREGRYHMFGCVTGFSRGVLTLTRAIETPSGTWVAFLAALEPAVNCTGKRPPSVLLRVGDASGAGPPLVRVCRRDASVLDTESGLVAINKWISAIEAAERSVFILSYGLNHKRILAALIAAESRGVRIRCLVDGQHQLRELQEHLTDRLKGADTRIKYSTNRIHAKVLLTDAAGESAPPATKPARLITGSANPSAFSEQCIEHVLDLSATKHPDIVATTVRDCEGIWSSCAEVLGCAERPE